MIIYALGSNGSGQLGVGHKEDLFRPERVLLPDVAGDVLHIAAGGNHTLFLCENGVFATGTRSHSGLTKHEATEDAIVPHQLQDVETGRPLLATNVSAIWAASFFHTGGRRILVSGSGEGGGHGSGDTTARQQSTISSPSLEREDASVVQLCSSMAHTIALLSNGEAYGWGRGRKGQLGHPAEDVDSPRRITGVEFEVQRIACGRDFTCFLGGAETGELAVIGARGRDRFSIEANAPRAVPRWKEVAASWGSVFVLEQCGKLVAWGRDDHGQLPPPSIPDIDRIAAGSEHCVALTKAGEVLAWGWGEHGNCGEHTDDRGDVKGRWNRVEVPGKVHSIFAGCATSFIVTDAG